MITLTDIDVINLLRKNGLDADELQTNVVELLAKNGLKIATAESCTGGLISERITSVSGASAVFDCGICSYANSIKEKLLEASAAKRLRCSERCPQKQPFKWRKVFARSRVQI